MTYYPLTTGPGLFFLVSFWVNNLYEDVSIGLGPEVDKNHSRTMNVKPLVNLT